MLGSEDDSDDFPRLSAAETGDASPRRKRLTRGERERNAESYEWTAWVSTWGVTSIAITATYLRLLREVTDTGAFPWAELFAQLALCAGAAVGMEFYARYAHIPWQGLVVMPVASKEWNRPIWLLHESHHCRAGCVRANDIFAIANGMPALRWRIGFLTGLFGGLCFGAGLGITLFGIMHVVRRNGAQAVPHGTAGKASVLRKIAAGHTIHHTEAFEGVPWGLFSAHELAACRRTRELEACWRRRTESRRGSRRRRRRWPPRGRRVRSRRGPGRGNTSRRRWPRPRVSSRRSEPTRAEGGWHFVDVQKERTPKRTRARGSSEK